jgi:hypothetical protein
MRSSELVYTLHCIALHYTALHLSQYVPSKRLAVATLLSSHPSRDVALHAVV